MKWLVFIFLIFGAGLGVGFYLWGADDASRFSQEMKNLVERAPAAEPIREDVIKKSLTASDITSGIVGRWESVDDPKFTRTFSVDSSVVDAYEDDAAATTEGRWAVFTAPGGEPPPFPISAGTIYLKIANPEEVLYFKVMKLESTELELIYLDGSGEQMRFARSNNN